MARYPVDQHNLVTTEFGVRDSNAYFGYHSGIDFGVGPGSNVYAPTSGQVWWAGSSRTGGNMLILFDGSYYHRLMHNSQLLVTSGPVTEGQVIAKSGSTGLSSGPHVHWDVARDMRSDLRPETFASFTNPVVWLALKRTQENVLIPDTDNYYWRFGKNLALRTRGRELSRLEFRTHIVNRTPLNAVEILSDDPEADAFLALGLWAKANKVAIEKRVADMQTTINELGKRPTQAQLDALNKQVETLQDGIVTATDKATQIEKELAAERAQRSEDSKLLDEGGSFLARLWARLFNK
jgi:septal ring factor EnvC (AmiA/AmiB activator)